MDDPDSDAGSGSSGGLGETSHCMSGQRIDIVDHLQ